MTGASSKKATLKFHVNELNMGGSRIVSEDIGTKKALSIDVSPIDQIDEVKAEKVEFIKIDVEGHEFDVLRGMKKTIALNKPIIAFEQEASEIVDGSSASIKELKEMGYNHFYSIECRRSIVTKVSEFVFSRIAVVHSWFPVLLALTS